MHVSLGIDVGTTSIKVCIVEAKTANVLLSERINHSTVSAVKLIGNEYFSEQSGLQIIEKVGECMEKARKSMIKRNCCHTSWTITSLVISGQMHGVILWNKAQSSSQLLANASSSTSAEAVAGTSSNDAWITSFKRNIELKTNLITWEDRRCNDEFIGSLPPSKSSLFSGYGCATMFWLTRYRPDIIENSQFAGSIMDLLVSYICDLDIPVMSDQIANSWGYFDNKRCSWQMDLLSQSMFPITLLPKLCMAGTDIGFMSRDWHFVSKGTLVKVAIGDCQCSFLSTCKDEVTAVINIGTSAQLAVKLPESCDVDGIKRISTAIQFFPYFGNSQLAVAASLNGGNVLNDFIKMVISWQSDLGLPSIDADHLHSKIRDIANNSELNEGCELKILPTINGERHDAGKFAQVSNIRLDNTSLVDVIQQIYVGLIRNLFDIMPLRLLSDLGIEQIVCTGSLFNDNHLLRTVVERVTGLQCFVESDVDAAYGAAVSIEFLVNF